MRLIILLVPLVLALILASCATPIKDCTAHRHGEAWVENAMNCVCDDGDVACSRIKVDPVECTADADCPDARDCPSIGVCMAGQCLVRCLSREEFDKTGHFSVDGCNESIDMDDQESLRTVSNWQEGDTLFIVSYVQGPCTVAESHGYWQLFHNFLWLFYDFDPVPEGGCECAQKIMHRLENSSRLAPVDDWGVAPLMYNEGISNILCGGYSQCFENMQCVLFPDAGTPVCAKAPVCDFYGCPEGTTCTLAGGSPVRVFCVQN